MRVIKRDGRKENFSSTKLKSSVHNACLGAGLDVKRAKEIEKKVSTKVIRILKGKKEIETIVIVKHIEKELKKINKDCLHVFKHYYDIN